MSTREDGPASPIVESRDQLVAYLEEGCKAKTDWRIGTEHEKFCFHTDDLTPIFSRSGAPPAPRGEPAPTAPVVASMPRLPALPPAVPIRAFEPMPRLRNRNDKTWGPTTS